jgi:hypothetical protein
MSERKRIRRRILIVDGPCQRRLITMASLVPLVAIVVTGLLLVWSAYALHDEALRAGVELQGFRPLGVALASFLFVAAGFVVLTNVRVSHRVSGPEYRLRKSLERIRGGDLGFTVQLRKGDQLGGLCDELNRLIEWLDEHPPAGMPTRARASGAVEPAPEPAGAGKDA